MAGDAMALSGVRNGEPLPAFRAPAFQDQPPLLGRHADQKTVGLLPVPTVRLKCTFALRHDVKTSAADLADGETLIVANARLKCQLRGAETLCYRPFPARPQWRGRPLIVGAPPEVFHSC